MMKIKRVSLMKSSMVSRRWLSTSGVPLSFSTVGNSPYVISCIGRVLPLVIEHGTPQARQRTLTLLLDQLPLYASDDVGVKSLLKLVKPADPDVVSQVIDKMCQPNSAAQRRRSIIVDLALSVNGSQLIQHVLPMVSFAEEGECQLTGPQANKEQRTLLYNSIKGHVVTLRGCRVGSRVIWLFDR